MATPANFRWLINEGAGNSAIDIVAGKVMDLTAVLASTVAWTPQVNGMSLEDAGGGVALAQLVDAWGFTGLTQCTLEIAFAFKTGFTVNHAQLIGLTDQFVNTTFCLQGDVGEATIEIAGFSTSDSGFIEWPAVGFYDGTPRVAHLRFDSTQLVLDDRVRLFLDGVDQGLPMSSNWIVGLGDGLVPFGGGESVTWFRRSQPWWVGQYAMYYAALSDAEIASNAAKLLANTNVSPEAPQLSLSPFDYNRLIQPEGGRV